MADFPEFILSTTETSKAIARAVEAKKLRELGSRLYTTNLRDNAEELVKRKLWDIVAVMVPNAVIVDRTALERKPASDGSVFFSRSDEPKNRASWCYTESPKRCATTW